MLTLPAVEVREAESPERLVPTRFMLLFAVRVKFPVTSMLASWLVVF